MIYFLDSSSFTKLFIKERGSLELRACLDPVRNEQKSCSVLARVEVRSGLQRRFRNREITQTVLDEAARDLTWTSHVWPMVPVNEDVLMRAYDVIGHHALRSLDAIQLSSALALRDDSLPFETLLFIATDERLLKAATAEGIATWNPELTPAP